MDWISGLQLSPAQEWDALICTSTVVKQTVDFVLDAQAEFLGARFGARHFPRPQLPIIPLGIDTAALHARTKPQRGRGRAALGIGADDIVVLFVGRLSFHAKAHPLPMYLGLERVRARYAGAQDPPAAGRLVRQRFHRARRSSRVPQTFCPSVQCGFVDGRNAEARHQAWAAADIFTSLSDNIQETYGLAPVEAHGRRPAERGHRLERLSRHDPRRHRRHPRADHHAAARLGGGSRRPARGLA